MRAAALLLGFLALAGATSHESASRSIDSRGVNAALTLKRSLVDRLDDATRPQVHPIYVIPADGTDRRLDVDGTLEAMLWSSQDWLAGRAGGLSLRMDTHKGYLDISFLRSRQTSTSLRNQQLRIVNRLREDLRLAGFTKNADKVALVLYDGPTLTSDGDPLCGASLGRLGLPRISFVNVRDPFCGPIPVNGQFSRRDKTIPHEVFHATGQVPDSAPSSDGDGHSTDRHDLMYGAGVTMRETEALVLDPGHDDYWNSIVRWLTTNHRALRIGIDGRGLVLADTAPNRYLGPAVGSCHRDCTLWFRKGARISLRAIADAGSSRFEGWKGACAGSRTCRVSMAANRVVTASFVKQP